MGNGTAVQMKQSTAVNTGSGAAAGFVKGLFGKKRPEPSYPTLPKLDKKGQTTLPGVYAVGEVAGTPLIKLGLNEGYDLVQRLAPDLKKIEGDGDTFDLVIIGSGSSGLGAASAARELGLKAVILEANHLAETIYTMTKGKFIFAEPNDVPNKTDIWLEECHKEELLERWTQQVDELGLDVRTFEKVTDIRKAGKLLEVESIKQTYKAKRVVLAIGKAGNPRKAGVAGETEHAARIDHRLIDPDKFRGRNIFVYGGGDVALEAALALCPHNRVSLVTIDPEFIYPKKRNIEKVLAQVEAGRIDLHFSSTLLAVEADRVRFSDASGGERSVPADHVFEMIGAELPLGFFEKVGIQLDNVWTWQRWVALAVVFFFVHALYALKAYPIGKSGLEVWRAWPYHLIISPETYTSVLQSLFEVAFLPFSWIFNEQARTDIMSNVGFQQGYLYSGLYTVLMLVFGFEAMIRWRGYARDKRYQTWRYLSLLAFQVGFFLIVNIIAVQAIGVDKAWRAWGLYQPFPLFFNTFFWWYESDPAHIMWFFIGAGLLGTFVGIPLLARWHGKRFCTWICGCGGLAETLGDRWRHLAPKGERSRNWEFQSVVIMVASFMVGLIVVGWFQTEGSNIWWQTYNFLVDFWLVAVIPIALYPFFGGKVWCRYWCPLAAYNQVLSKKFGLLKIVSNDKCISCTQCSKYCQVGVDVMAFAKNQTPFDNANSSCIHCGICIDVCPMDVLSFQTGDKPAGAQGGSVSV